MFDLFKSVKIQLDVELDRSVYAPGDTGTARITLKNDKEFNIQGGRFTITCQQKYQYRHKTRDSDGHTKVETTWGTHDTEILRFDFLPEMPLPPGRHEFDTNFTLDAYALPTSSGEIVKVTWLAKATLDRKLAADTNREISFTVVTTNPQDITSATAGEYGESNQPDEAKMSFVLKTKEVTGGAVLAGSLRILPSKDFGVNEVRLEFLRDEYVTDISDSGYDHRKEITLLTSKLAGKTQLSTGQYLEYPFRLELPQDLAPSVQFNVGSLTYKVKGILARTLRKDTSVEEEVRAYAG